MLVDGDMGSRALYRKYRCRTLRPSRQGVVPTDCLIIQEPCVTLGINLKVPSRRLLASAESPPAKNLFRRGIGQCWLWWL